MKQGKLMGENSKIEWCTHTFNPWLGCQKVSPGCDFCYAEALLDTRLHAVQWGPHGDRRRTSLENWTKPLRWAKAAAAAGIRHRVFCASLADWLDNRVPQSWRADLAVLIGGTPELDWLLLTKRIENYRRLSPWGGPPPRNVWLGVTCEDQERFDQRYPILANIPAKVHFISYEPAIGPLTIRNAYPAPDWIICGGESGRSARYMDPSWAGSLLEECETARVPFFMKQMTDKTPIPDHLLVRRFPGERRPSLWRSPRITYW
jgi:protein gp37